MFITTNNRANPNIIGIIRKHWPTLGRSRATSQLAQKDIMASYSLEVNDLLGKIHDILHKTVSKWVGYATPINIIIYNYKALKYCKAMCSSVELLSINYILSCLCPV